MREIKFRVWDDRSKMFHYWGFVDNCFVGITTGSDFSISDCKDFSEQFTGLTDMNGKDIYEGDICRALGGESDPVDRREIDITGTIMFRGCAFDLVKDGCGYGLDYALQWDSLEIIGNVHE